MRTYIAILGVAVLAWPAAAIDFGAAWDALWEESPAQTHKNQATDQETAKPHMGTGVYRVTGRGAVPPDAKSDAQGRLLAMGAAQLDALRKLATLLEGADISTESTTNQYVQTDYTVKETTKACLKGVRLLETRFNEDGIAEVDVELVLTKAGQEPDFSSLEGYRIRTRETVAASPRQAALESNEPDKMPAEAAENAQGKTDATPQSVEHSSKRKTGRKQQPIVREEDLSDDDLYHKSLESMFDVWSSTLSGVSDAMQQEEEGELAPQEHRMAMAEASGEPHQVSEPAQTKESEEEVVVGKAKVEPPEVEESYTDLVIDARGFGLIPSTSVRAITPKGEQIFPFQGGILEKFTPPNDPEVRFLGSLDEAPALPGYGGQPLIIEADGVQLPGRTDIVIEKRELMKLTALRESRIAHGDGYVIVLTDK
ncbi:MAG: hypothetical protein R6V12_18590 [Candidatus Hydrogenedentota bacterium]